jgi:ribonucleoside-diphosphate reductase subunit M2
VTGRRSGFQDKQSTFGERCIAFACVEGIFFSGAFCSIFWMKERGPFDLCFSNELISRDEALHTNSQFYFTIFFSRRTGSPKSGRDGRQSRFHRDQLHHRSSAAMLGMNATAMTTYIQFVADRLLLQMGFSALQCSKSIRFHGAYISP